MDQENVLIDQEQNEPASEHLHLFDGLNIMFLISAPSSVSGPRLRMLTIRKMRVMSICVPNPSKKAPSSDLQACVGN